MQQCHGRVVDLDRRAAVEHGEFGRERGGFGSVTLFTLEAVANAPGFFFKGATHGFAASRHPDDMKARTVVGPAVGALDHMVDKLSGVLQFKRRGGDFGFDARGPPTGKKRQVSVRVTRHGID